MYDETIKKILNLNDISQVRPHNNYVYNKLKSIGNKEGWLPRSVFGHLIIPLDEKDGGEPSLVLLTNPVLIRFHDTTRSSALSDSLAAEMRADSLLNDSLAHDSFSAEKSGRLSIEELRNQQKGERKIDVVKKKGYTIQPNRRKQQNQNQRRRR
jgi:hypothetical protein